MGLFAAILGGLFYLFQQFGGKSTPDTPQTETETVQHNKEYDEARFYLPKGAKGQVIHNKFSSFCYNEEHEQAEWVAYILDKENLKKERVDRTDFFEEDTRVKTGSATHYDYKGSGYDRGHLVPAADMAFDLEAMEQSFLMSNISPQARNFNQGVWRELEETIRSWTFKWNKLYIVTGPVLGSNVKGRIGENDVSVPVAYYKVVLDITDPEWKAIGFMMPNQVSYAPLYQFAVSVDDIEDATGLNFFSDLLDKELEKKLEAEFNIDLWPFSKAKFQERIEKWNQLQNE